jgi:protein tyrosine phosphatase
MVQGFKFATLKSSTRRLVEQFWALTMSKAVENKAIIDIAEGVKVYETKCCAIKSSVQ